MTSPQSLDTGKPLLTCVTNGLLIGSMILAPFARYVEPMEDAGQVYYRATPVVLCAPLQECPEEPHQHFSRFTAAGSTSTTVIFSVVST